MAQAVIPTADNNASVSGAGGPPKKKRGVHPHGKLGLTILILAAAAAAAAIALYLLVFKEDDTRGAIMTGEVMRGSIQSVVEGSGTTSARESVVVTPEAGGIVQELFVQEGDQVTAGDPLYIMDDTQARNNLAAVEKEREDAQKAVSNCRKELQAVYDSIADLDIRAPHAGKLIDVAEVKPEEEIAAGTRLATLVNDTRLRLKLYYSYAYEGQIKAGQTVQISLPAVMTEVTGQVEEVSYVRRVVPEGGVMFEVTMVLDNPGTLTEGMAASAALTAADGSPIYPYEDSQLKYFEVTDIVAKTGGPLEQFHMKDYADVKAGQTLAQLGRSTQDEEIASRELALQSAETRLTETEEKLQSAQQSLENHNATAPISGTVLACNLLAGEAVQSGQAITIADTSVMTINITVDERHVQYVKPGMWVDIDQWGTYFGGEVESVSQMAQAENGVARFPAVVKVDNPDGQLMSNMYVNYSFVASQSDNCLTVPVQAVRYVTLADAGGMPEEGDTGEDQLLPEAAEGAAMPEPMPMPGGRPGRHEVSDSTATVVFVQADHAPDSAIAEPDPAWECPKGFWVVPVKTGLADNTSVEILEGLNEGDVVFIGYETQQADNWG